MRQSCRDKFSLYTDFISRRRVSQKRLSELEARSRKTRGFQKHEMSQAHKEATIRYVKSSSNQPDVVDMVSSEAEKQRFKNRQMLLKILTNIRFLARQGLPLRGSWNKEYNIEIDSNCH